MPANWIFDLPTASGCQSGGSAAEYGFSGRIDTLVRETLQNSMDAVLDNTRPVEVTYRLIELSDESLDDFLKSMQWEELLEHLQAVPESRNGEAILQALKRLREGREVEDSEGNRKFEAEPAIRLLVIEDRNTCGLEGNEDRETAEERNPYRSLTFDELYSDKFDPNAGGSFGLGKIVLWAFSAFGTVLFSSIPRTPPETHTGLRFIGRSSLPAHWTESDQFTGKGWFGTQVETHHGLKRAHSVWGESAQRLADSTYCAREADDAGTSVVIVGFSEPGYEDRELDILAREIVDSAIESFWPAMAMNRAKVTVKVEMNGLLMNDLNADPQNKDGFAVVHDLYQRFKRDELVELERLDNPGDCGYRNVDLKIPERRNPEDEQHDEFTLKQPVVVQILTGPEAVDSIKDRIFRFRKQGMLVGRTHSSNLSITAKPYVAILPAGLVSGATIAHRRADRFLRDAEPPEHDRWAHDTKAIKTHYKTYGLKTSLERFENDVRLAIRDLVSIPERKGGSLPEHVRKMLNFGNKSGGGESQFVSMQAAKAEPSEQGWKFAFRCRRLKEIEGTWTVRVRLLLIADGGHVEDSKALAFIDCDEASHSLIENGDAFLVFSGDVEQVSINGTTDPRKLSAAARRAGVQLKVDGWKGGVDHA